MAFIDDATENLTPEEFAKMHDISALVAAFESTPEQEKELAELKAKVWTALGDRSRLKHLSFLSAKSFSALDVLKTAGYSRKEIMHAVGILFPRDDATVSEPIATYPSANGPMHYKDGERMTKELKQAIAAGGVKIFAANLTAFGKAHLAITRTVEKGAKAGTIVYPNLLDTCKRLGFQPEDLKVL